MKRELSLKSVQFLVCLVAIGLWRYGPKLDGTEFSEGRVTGTVLEMYNIGVLLFGVALLSTFFLRRLAGGIVLVASLLSLPLYLYFVARGPFQWLFGWENAVAPTTFVWSRMGTAGIIILLLSTTVGSYALFARTSPSTH